MTYFQITRSFTSSVGTELVQPVQSQPQKSAMSVDGYDYNDAYFQLCKWQELTKINGRESGRNFIGAISQ